MNARSLALVVLLSLPAAVGHAEPQAAVQSARTYAAYAKRADLKIAAGKGSLVALSIAGEVLADCAPDLSDLRLVDAAGHEIPYAVEMPLVPDGRPSAGSTQVMAHVNSTAQRGGVATGDDTGMTELYELAPTPAALAHAGLQLYLDIAQLHFVRQVAFGPKGASSAARGHASIFRISHGTVEQTHLAIPTNMVAAGKPLVVELTGVESAPLEPIFSWGSLASTAKDERISFPLSHTESTPGRVTALLVERAPGLVPSALRFAASTARFQRNVRVYDGPGPASGARLAEGLLLRTGAPGDDVLDLPVSASRGRNLRVEIENEDSPPLAELKVFALVVSPMVVFAAPANADAVTLRFGGGRARRPRYDVTGLVRVPGVSARLAQVQNVSANHVAVVRTAGIWPAVPAAAVDARRYSHARTFAVNARGDSASSVLSRIPLGVAELAVLRTDRGDVRISDDKHRSWPYVLTDSEEPTSLPVTFSARSAADPKRSVFDIALPASPMVAQFFVLESRDLQLNRPYTLKGMGGKGAELFALSGTLMRDLEPLDGEDNGNFVARIALPNVAVSALRLEVQNGDNLAPEFEQTRVLARTAALVAPLPAGSYELLFGRSEEAPPVYDLESSRAAVLAAERFDVSFATGFGPNGAFRPLLAQPAPGGVPPWLLWSSLVVAVLVLGAITLRQSVSDPPSG